MTQRTAERLLTWILRLGGLGMLVAVVPMLMPLAWMDAVHRRMDLGPLPEGPVVEYLARLTSGLYALLGAIQWALSGNVRRYRGPIVALGAGVAILTAIISFLAYRAGMPVWWVVGDAVTAVGYGAAVSLLAAWLDPGRMVK